MFSFKDKYTVCYNIEFEYHYQYNRINQLNWIKLPHEEKKKGNEPDHRSPRGIFKQTKKHIEKIIIIIKREVKIKTWLS